MQGATIEIPAILLLLGGVVLASIVVAKLPSSEITWVKKSKARLGLGELNSGLFLLLLCYWATLFIFLFLGLLWTIYEAISAAIPADEASKQIWSWRFSVLKLASLTAVLGAVVALPFTLIRLALTREQVNIAEQGLITDRLNKTIEALGAEKQTYRLGRDASYALGNETIRFFEFQDAVTSIPRDAKNRSRPEWKSYSISEPNLEMRVGAIYALERIAKDSPRDHIQIFEILCAYIRENAPCHELLPDQLPTSRAKPRIDIQAAITVFGRRTNKGLRIEQVAEKRFDLSDCNLAGVDFTGGRYWATDFHDTVLEGAIFNKADMRGSHFQRSNLRFATFWDANFTGTSFDSAALAPLDRWDSINTCNLSGASFFAVDMSVIHLRSALEDNATIGNLASSVRGYSEQELVEIKSELRKRNPTKKNGLFEIRKTLIHPAFRYWTPYRDEDLANNHILKLARSELGMVEWPYS